MLAFSRLLFSIHLLCLIISKVRVRFSTFIYYKVLAFLPILPINFMKNSKDFLKLAKFKKFSYVVPRSLWSLEKFLPIIVSFSRYFAYDLYKYSLL